MDLERIKRINYLENTVLLYRGTAKMFELWRNEGHACEERSDPQPEWEEFETFAKKMEKNAGIVKDSRNVTVEWRYQNPLKDFFQFLEYEQQISGDSMHKNTISKWAARLLCLYDCLESIDKHRSDPNKHTCIPYFYERLCNSMSKIAGSDMCYLVYFQDGGVTPLATSSFAMNLLDYVLDESDFLEIHNQWKRHRRIRADCEATDSSMGQPIADTVFRTEIWKKSAQENNLCRIRLLVLRLEVPKEKKEKLYIVFQYADETPDKLDIWKEPPHPLAYYVENADLKKMRDILFLRSRLAMLTSYCLHILILSQTTCRYVRQLGDTNSLNVLHLTDLHIKTKDKTKLEAIFGDFPSRAPNDKPYDLVVITGDVVQGQGSAGELEEQYLLADKLLRMLAKRLWQCSDPKYLRADWRKRIIIIPGNHDYAAMNELEVVRQKGIRSTGTGRPSRKEGGPMVKFAYYLHFIRRLLGIDIGEQVNDWLNSVRYYNQMQLSLLCLNTSAGAGPLRNNKVHIDKEYIDKLKKIGHFGEKITICLAHHTSEYKPDYAVDRYATPKIWREAASLVQQFREILALDPEKDEGEICKRLDDLSNDLMIAGLNTEDALMAEVSYYKKNFRSTEDERCESIRSAMQRDDIMQKADQNKLFNAFKVLDGALKIKITLGGHIHKFRASSVTHCYEGSLFYDSDKDFVNYAVLSIDTTKNVYDWVPYEHEIGKDPVEQTSKAKGIAIC